MADSTVLFADDYGANPFDNLPLECNQHIASFLDCDVYVCRFRLICKSTRDAIDEQRCYFWRKRFKEYFEDPGHSTYPSGEKYKTQYKRRKYVLKHGARFRQGGSNRERECLEVLRDLICESFSGVEESDLTYESLNLAQVTRFAGANNLIQELLRHDYGIVGRRGPEVLLLQTIQVLCTPLLLSLDPALLNAHYSFPDSQYAVYSTPKEYPLFFGAEGLDVNMAFVLHNVNFWKYHMIREAELTLYNAFSALEEHELPRWWSNRLQQGTKKLGKHWKGSYGFVDRDDVRLVRGKRGDQEHIQDLFAGEDEDCTFQDMTLSLMDDNSMPWPPRFEDILRSLTPPSPRAGTRTRAQKRHTTPQAIAHFAPQSFRFEGNGNDNMESFLASGWLNPLPPQSGVPGWHRITMMKYFEDEDTGLIDETALWAYEGVVLPGGQIILGRWWSPADGEGEDMYSGPFVLWCVDGPQYAEEDQGMKDGWGLG